MDVHDNNDEVEIDLESTGEDNAVEPELEEVEEVTGNKLKDLRTKLKAVESEKMDALEQLQRAKADFLNARKRLEEERLRDRERAVEEQVERLLPLYDSFAMAMQNKEAWENVDQNWRVGVEGIFAQLKGILDSYQVRAIDPIGQPFDPNTHEAVSEQPVDDQAQDHTVLAVVQTGFVRTVGNTTTVIRPARVVVGTFNS